MIAWYGCYESGMSFSYLSSVLKDAVLIQHFIFLNVPSISEYQGHAVFSASESGRILFSHSSTTNQMFCQVALVLPNSHDDRFAEYWWEGSTSTVVLSPIHLWSRTNEMK